MYADKKSVSTETDATWSTNTSGWNSKASLRPQNYKEYGQFIELDGIQENEYDLPLHRRRSKRCRSSVCMSLCMSTLSILTCIGVVLFLLYQHNVISFQPKSEMQHGVLCVNCSEIQDRKIATEMWKEGQSFGREFHVCCANKPHQLEYLSKENGLKDIGRPAKSIEPETTSSTDGFVATTSKPEDAGPPNPVAHFKAQPMPIDQLETQNTNGREEIYQWSPSVLKRVSFANNEVKILVSGFYFVYSQVRFVQYHDMDPGVPVLNPYYSHYVYNAHDSLPNGGQVLLMHGSESSVKQETEQRMSYLGGIFHLQKDSVVSVRVSNVSQVVMDPASTFFGLFMLK